MTRCKFACHSEGMSQLNQETCRYEMYAEEPKVSSFNEDGTARASHSNTPLPAESGPALEVIQLANGEMIWYG